MPARGARYAAKIAGEPIYFSGKPCRNGHSGPRRTGNGLCLECERAFGNRPDQLRARQAWADANVEKRRVASLGWYRRNRESILAAQRTARANDPDRRELDRRRRARHRERFAAYFREWALRNRDAVRAHIRNNKAKRKAAQGTHSADDVRALLVAQEWRCAYCYRSVEDGAYQVDHIVPLAKGGTNWPANLCIACPTCNQRKQYRSADEFREILRKDNR